MHLLRASVLLGSLLVATAGTGTAACFVCSDPGLRKSECSMRRGTYDEDSCACTGAEDYPRYPSYPTPDAGSDDAGCRRERRVDESKCATDLDCRSGAECVIDGAIGTCLVPCLPDTVCPPTSDLGTCETDADCRVDAGATCVCGRCAG